MEIPKLKFSKWHKWCDKNDIENINYPGIYAIAITHKNLDGSRLEYKDVVYIGMTNSQKGLSDRLRKFDSSIKGKTGHSGANEIYAKLGNYDEWAKNEKLFVAVMPIKCDTERRNSADLRKMGMVAALEYMAFAKFQDETKDEDTIKYDRPEYNTH